MQNNNDKGEKDMCLDYDAEKKQMNESKEFQVGDKVIYINGDAAGSDKFGGVLSVLARPTSPGVDGEANYKVIQIERRLHTFFVPGKTLRLATDEELKSLESSASEKTTVKSMHMQRVERDSNETRSTDDSDTKKAEDKSQGKFYLEVSMRTFFDTKEEMEHYVKEHLSVPFEGKVLLLAGENFEHLDDEGDMLIMKTGENE